MKARDRSLRGDGAPLGLPMPDGLPAIACLLTHPDQVVVEPALTEAEKRQLLAAWISDACSVENRPGLRRWVNGAVAKVEDLRKALAALDRHEASTFLATISRPENRLRFRRRRRPGRGGSEGGAAPCLVPPRQPTGGPLHDGQALELTPSQLLMDAT